MAQDHHIKSYTGADIERYHKGLMAARERNALEKAALDDPFLADALEGFRHAGPDGGEDLDALRNRLAARIDESKHKKIIVGGFKQTWWKIAAMVVLVAGAGLFIYRLGFHKSRDEIAQAPQKQQPLKSDTANAIGVPGKTGVSDQAANHPSTVNQTTDSHASTAPGAGKEAGAIAKKDGQESRVEINLQAKELPAVNEIRQEQKTAPPVAAETPEEVIVSETNIADRLSEQEKTTDQEKRKGISARRSDAPQTRGYTGSGNTKIHTFRGRVTDASNNALPFSNITNLDDNIGTYTDVKGNFTLTSPDTVLNVQIRSLGFEASNVQLHPSTSGTNIPLAEDRSLNARILDTTKRNINRDRHSTLTLHEPEPVDGWTNYDTYLANNLKKPDTYRPKQTGGEVELSFDVDEKGEPVNIRVKKSLCESCDREAIRLLKEGPRWKRKIKNGKGTITIVF